MPLASKHERETNQLPGLRRAVSAVEDPQVQNALFGLLALVHDLTEEVDRLNYHLGRLEARNP
jgi:hypothetical protein